MKPRDGVYRTAVSFCDVMLHCEGSYIKGHEGDQTDPPEPAMFELSYVKHLDEDILDLLGEQRAAILSAICISELESGGGYEC